MKLIAFVMLIGFACAELAIAGGATLPPGGPWDQERPRPEGDDGVIQRA